jgi:hypothetical protein
MLLAGLKVPRYDRLQDTMQSLVDNLSLFNYRELLVCQIVRQRGMSPCFSAKLTAFSELRGWCLADQ